jgi:predicted phage terminase large subunit-like protein
MVRYWLLTCGRWRNENATTPWKFDREQQQEVTEEKNKIFQREWMNNDYEFLPDGNILRLCDNQIVNPDQMVIVDGTDLAISKNDKADFFTNVTIAMDDRFNTYILDCIKNKFTFDEQKDSIVNQHRTWGSQMVGVEAVQYQTALAQHLAFTTEVPVVEVPRVKDKIQRAFGIQPYFQNRKVFFRKGKHGLIKEELNDFPDSPHDDVFDGLETAMHLAVERVRKTKAIREAKMVKSTTVEQFRDPKVIEERLGAF